MRRKLGHCRDEKPVRRALRLLKVAPPERALVLERLSVASDAHRTPQVRKRAVKSLARYAIIDDQSGKEILAKLMDEAQVTSNSGLAKELSNAAWRVQLNALARMRAQAVIAAQAKMRELGAKDARDLLTTVSNSAIPIETRVAAIGTLGSLRARVPISQFLKVMSEPVPNLAWAIAHAIGEIGSRRFTRPLIELVRRTGDGASRQAAITALGDLNDPRAVPLLTGIVNDVSEREDIRALAADALSLMANTKGTQAALIGLTRASSPALRYSGVCALSPWIANLRVREALEARMEDRASVPNRESVGELARGILSGGAPLPGSSRAW